MHPLKKTMGMVEHIIRVASPGYGRAAVTVSVGREGCNSKKPGEMWPVTDGSASGSV